MLMEFADESGICFSAGSLNAPRLLEHAGAGVTLTQLLTDFGRTVNLVSYSKLLDKAQNANALATAEDIVLATDQAFYNALEAEALLKYKHPDHFNTLGASHWRGKIYGGDQIGVRIGGDVIYHGMFGTGLFQTIYRQPASMLAMMMISQLWMVSLEGVDSVMGRADRPGRMRRSR